MAWMSVTLLVNDCQYSVLRTAAYDSTKIWSIYWHVQTEIIKKLVSTVMIVIGFWNVTPCSLVRTYQCFRGLKKLLSTSSAPNKMSSGATETSVLCLIFRQDVLLTFNAVKTSRSRIKRHIVLSSVVCPALPHSFTLPRKRHDFREKSYWTQNVCFDFLYNFCLKHF